VGWLNALLRFFGLKQAGISISIPLPSFYKEPDLRPSNTSDFDPDDVPDVMVSRDFAHAHPILVERYKLIVGEYALDNPGKSLIATCTYRSPKEQARLYALGRVGHDVKDYTKVVTNCDGKTKKSDHNQWPARAIDCAVLVGGKVIWDEAEYYCLGKYAKKYGLEWGGFWQPPKFKPDFPHFYLPKNVAQGAK